MPVLSTLNLPRRQKYALVGVFALGFFVCIISGLRLMSLIVVEREQPYDATYTSANMIYWTAVEVNASISCACIMTFKPLIQRLFPRLLSPSKDAREPALQWITPVTGTTTNNNNNNNANPDTSIRPNPAAAAAEPGPQPASRHTPSPSTNPFHRRGSSGSALCPHHRPSRDDSTADADHDDPLEKSRYYHGTLNPAAAYAYSLDDDDDDHDHDHAFDLHRDDGLDTDLEAQRPCACACACSVSSTTMGGGGALTATTTATTTTASHSGRSSVGGEEGGADGALDGEEERAAALRAPPRAHLGLGLGLRGTAAAAGVGDRRD
ncbi:uncharacterized protein THITE_2122347 [Thermothielavioides terrestris NRRL 8126]|uniref:Rhodopsin domain-containing protein n=2 Tax=Thermothielavioides terrestris TaxID=2587410 RepID=G2RCT1_THETT|nr:uncharacterized protein THITE_2122347 [Thermothielavioides terrestris NRRL 8126]AEO70677.1 hypothetical protein THITE_2122347 [Thermothielavioides terrestris NRRL 8126]